MGTKEAGTAYPPNPHYSCSYAHEEYIKTHKPPERRLITKFVYHAALRVSALGAYSPWKAPLDSKQGHSTQPTAAPSPAPPSASPAPAPATCQWHRAIFRAAPRSPSRSYSPSSLRAAVAVPGAHASGDEGARWYALRSVCFEVEARCVQNADLRGGGMSRMRPVSRPKASPPDYPTASSAGHSRPCPCTETVPIQTVGWCQPRVEHGVQAATQRTRVRRVRRLWAMKCELAALIMPKHPSVHIAPSTGGKHTRNWPFSAPVSHRRGCLGAAQGRRKSSIVQ